LGGGALLDIGIYPVFMATSLLGRPDEIEAVMSPYPSGVDEQISAVLKFNKGALAITSATFAAITPVEATLVGTEGYIRMTNRFHNAVANIELVTSEGSEQVPVHKEEGFGYQFEARHVGECLRKNLIESPVMSHKDSLLLMETLDRIRAKCGIRYEVD
jgi:predicted dehydrogenase